MPRIELVVRLIVVVSILSISFPLPSSASLLRRPGYQTEEPPVTATTEATATGEARATDPPVTSDTPVLTATATTPLTETTVPAETATTTPTLMLPATSQPLSATDPITAPETATLTPILTVEAVEAPEDEHPGFRLYLPVIFKDNGPQAIFAADPVLGPIPLRVTFANSSTQASRYVWDFGDGWGSSVVTPSHTYTQAGVYTVTLIAGNGSVSNTLTRINFITPIQLLPPDPQPDLSLGILSAFPSTSVLDNFNRSNGTIGSNWSGSTSGYSIVSNQLDVGAAQDIYWNGTSFGADQEVYVTLTTVDGGTEEQDLLLKSQSSSTWNSGVIEVWYDAPGDRVQVWTYSSGQDWVQRGSDIAVTFDDGDQFGARATAAGQVEVYRNGTLLGSRSVTGWPYYANSGYIGLWFVNASNAVLDDFGGGTAAAGPDPVFSGSPVSGTVPLTVTFTNSSTNASSYLWKYGTGAISTTTAVSHTYVYTQAGVYTVTLSASDGTVTNTLTRTNYISVNLASPPSFPTTNVLDNFNRSNGGIGGNWSGGGTSGYSIAGNRLDVLSGADDIYWNGVSFGPDQEVYVTLVSVDPAGDEQDLLLKSQSNSTWGSGVIEVWYDAADELVQVVTFTSVQGWVQRGADIPVTFEAGDQFGARATAAGQVEVYQNGTLLATRDITGWPYYANGGYIGLWFITAGSALLDDFGGGGVSNAPIASFSASPLTGTMPLTVTFVNSSTNAISYLWDFGDSLTSTVVTPTHSYTQAGVYTVILTATGLSGSQALTRPNYITVSGEISREWQIITPTTTSPPIIGEHSLAYDSSRNIVILYGGNADGWPYEDTTWEFDGTNWLTITTSTQPEARYGTGLAYDPANQVTVLFGGSNEDDTVFNQTWAYTDSDWVQLFPSTSPLSRTYHSLATNPLSNTIYLFGGNDHETYFNDLWVYESGDWTEISASGPVSRTLAAMTYDTVNNRLLLFGGRTVIGTLLADLWAFDPTTETWTELDDGSSGSDPLARMAHSLAFDPATGNVVLVGGVMDEGDTILADTWEYRDGSGWVEVSMTSGRAYHQAVYGNNAIILFGNEETWKYE